MALVVVSSRVGCIAISLCRLLRPMWNTECLYHPTLVVLGIRLIGLYTFQMMLDRIRKSMCKRHGVAVPTRVLISIIGTQTIRLIIQAPATAQGVMGAMAM